ncbi:MAG: exosortase E/protease, VPEID-CTERM system [Acidobacteriota bacterium]
MSAPPQLSQIRMSAGTLLKRHPDGLKRLGMLVALLLVELLAITTWLDGSALFGRPGLAGQIGITGAWVLRFVVGFAAAFAAFSSMQGTLKVAAFLEETTPIRWTALSLHVAGAAIFVLLSAALYGNWPGVSMPNLLAAGWVLTGLLTLLAACLTFYRLSLWVGIVRSAGAVWAYAAGVAALGCVAAGLSQSMWQSAARLTFQLVQLLLRPMIPNLTADPAKLMLRGQHFGVIISQECSGLEGMGLMLVFSVVWLWLFRKDFRFPRAYLLVPAGILTLYALNAVRIAALLVIGEAGAKRIAAGGFHSQAGWIAFNGVALGMTLVVPRMRWFSLHPVQRAVRAAPRGENAVALYLLPFLAILASGMLSRAASADFEWLYGLRFLAVVATVWMFRGRLKQFDWRVSAWLGPATGAAIFALWLAFDWWQAIPAVGMPRPLAAAGGAWQTGWIVLRTLAAVTTVPIAEELAFRGFVSRRLMKADFEAIPLGAVSWWGIVGSSVLFGLLHGERWMAGILAGLAFALVVRRSGRLGDAILAHGVTNALLAVWVLYLGQWQYW